MGRRAILGLVALSLAGCGGGTSSRVDLTFTRADGSVAEFPTTLRAWCGPLDEDNQKVEAVHVFAGELPRGERPESYWVVNAVREDVARDAETSLPNSFNYMQPEGLSLFVYDTEARENELSSAAEESSGTIRIELEGCDPGDSVTTEFDDVVLGSEYHDLPTMSVSGEVEAEIGEPPG